MAKQFTRADRVAQQIQRDLATIIRAELDHPQASLITITDVEVTRDYSHANVFYTFLGTTEQGKDIASLLERAKGFLRSQLARGISLYKMPELHFEYDHSVEHGMNLSRLIDQASSLPKAPEEDGIDADDENTAGKE
ncbi:30S ribosome-binding factor RbfA [Iodobacter fluviatilis]|uniref:Ribosome-binding factor A n=1 Tax=Iodobacter fluviatilis TaxID=537 RepID=A0A377Q7I0_9NEIS|nr:30S ribosome-binding factor RbfA [Iodobacter fluviatilis]TCU89442.1 ribosome-binding factor A [Iodobacter fluviatilis]STQ90812.1 Ribosome-binding factor A [Iodobacter fluviatilis]